MNWILRHGTLNGIVILASLVWCESMFAGNIASYAIAFGVSYLLWFMQCVLFLLIGIIKMN